MCNQSRWPSNCTGFHGHHVMWKESIGSLRSRELRRKPTMRRRHAFVTSGVQATIMIKVFERMRNPGRNGSKRRLLAPRELDLSEPKQETVNGEWTIIKLSPYAHFERLTGSFGLLCRVRLEELKGGEAWQRATRKHCLTGLNEYQRWVSIQVECQEKQEKAWLVKTTDGEGCFSRSIE